MKISFSFPVFMTRKGKQRLISIFIFALLLGCIYWLRMHEKEYLPHIQYKNFGTRIPAGYEVIGIDVSHHQNIINWPLANEMEDHGKKISFVFMKATQGTWMKDKQFDRNWKEVKKQELIRGAYIYFEANHDGKKQAEWFIKHVRLEPGDLPPVIDIEETFGMAKEKMFKELKECILTLEEHYGVRPIIYTYSHFIKKHFHDEFEFYPVWIAHYVEKGSPDIDREWAFWQHSDHGNVNGILGKVDFNVFNGSLYRLKNFCLE